jgi:WD40 repeat protein
MRNIVALFIIVFCALVVLAQNPSPSPTPPPTPDSQRGLGIQSATSTSASQSGQQSREAKPELVLQTGYNNLYGATRLVFSPDGRLLATATFRSNTVKLWETATGRKLRDISSSGQNAPGLAPYVAFSRDGRLIATATADNSVKVWDVTSGRELQTLAGPQGSMIAAVGVYFIGFAANNQIVTVSDAVRVWDVNTGRELRTLQINATDVVGSFNGSDGGMVLSADGTQFAVFSDESEAHVKLIDLASGRESRRFKLADSLINSLQLIFTPDGRLLAAGIIEKRFKLWDLTAKKDQELTRTAKDYSFVKFSRDGRLVALSENYNVRIWDLASLRELTSLKVPNTGLYAGDAFINFSEDGKRIATGGFDTDVILWEIETGKRLANLTGRTNMAFNVAFSADGTQLYTGDRTRWDLRTGRGLRLTARSLDKTWGFTSPDGRLLAVMRPNNAAVSIVEVASGQPLHTLAPSGNSPVIVQRVRFSPDGTTLAVIYGQDFSQPQAATPVSYLYGSRLQLWDVKTGRELRHLVSTYTPTDANFSNDGRTIAGIGTMGEISVWDTQSGQKLRDLTSSPISGFMKPINPGNIKPGQMPTMPNAADINAMMSNVFGITSTSAASRRPARHAAIKSP